MEGRGFKPVDNDFYGNFIRGIIEAYRSEVFKRCSIFVLGNKAKEGGIMGAEYCIVRENLFVEVDGFLACNIPEFLKEEGVQVIRAW